MNSNVYATGMHTILSVAQKHISGRTDHLGKSEEAAMKLGA